MRKIMFAGALVASLFGCAMAPSAQEVKITPDLSAVTYAFNGESFLIQRNQDPEARISAFYSKTSRACPPFCVQPISVHEGVDTVGELEVLAFLTDHVDDGTGFIIDSRTADFYAGGTIPGAVNLPHNLFIPSDDNVFFDSIMVMLKGEKDASGKWTFTDPSDLMMFCNGPWCGQSPNAIRNLLAINYPADKIHYYRGGMQNWNSMGFSVQVPHPPVM